MFLQNWKIFFKPVRPTFPKETHIYNIIFNRKKIKVNCRYVQNIKSIVNNHKVLNNTAGIEESGNCRNRNNCLLDGKCVTTNIIYEGQITSNQPNYKEKKTQEPSKQILNADLTTTQNHSTSNIMKRHRTM